MSLCQVATLTMLVSCLLRKAEVLFGIRDGHGTSVQLLSASEGSMTQYDLWILDLVVQASYKYAENSVMNDNENVGLYIEKGKQSRALARNGDKPGAELLRNEMKALLQMIK